MKFSEIDLHPLVRSNVEKAKYADCTPVQELSIPHILQGRDIAGLAQTGTGKTAAFLLPLIDRVLRSQELAAQQPPVALSEEVPAPEVSAEPVEPQAPAMQAGEVIGEGQAEEGVKPEELHLRYFPEWRRRNFILILVPTRELAEQVYENAKLFTEGTNLKAVAVYGGTTYDKQKAAFRDGFEFVVATPGRLIDLYKEHIVDLRQVRAVVFDEADRMFDMGFKDDMKYILKRIPRERQFLVFSATLNFDVLNTAYEFGAFPVEINISKDQPKAEHVTDELFHVGHFEKPGYLLSVLKKRAPRQTIIFSNFKHNVERITRFLNDNGVPAVGISSLLTQAQRNRVMAQFKAENDRNILVATDVAARGLDILGVDLVINYDLPDDPENYVHRIGRTGRAGQTGHATALVSDRDVDALGRIETYMGKKIVAGWLEDAELVKEYKPFPADHGPRPFKGGGGERGFDRGGARGGGRGGSGGRGGGGRGGPRREGQRSEGRGEGRGPRGPGGDRPHRGGGDRPYRDEARRDEPRHDQPRGAQSDDQQQRSEGRPQGSGRPDDRHRDRRTGRHGGSGGGGGGGEQRRHGQGQRQGGSGGPKQGGGQQRRDQRPQQHRRGAQRPQGASRPYSGAKPAAMSANPSIGQKVTGLIKKLFGKSPTKS